MAQNSKIEWTDTTWNVLAGCDKVSDGCKNCYAMHQAHIRAGNPNLKVKAAYEGTTVKPEGGRVNWTGKINLLADRLEQPLHWKKPRKVFVNAMSDLFHEDVPFEFIHKIEAISASTKHTYQILTKRPQRALEYFHEYRKMKAPLNWWLGVSVEDQKTADERIPLLLQIPAAVRFLSCEPLLGEVDLSKWITVHKVKPVQRWFYAKCNTCGYIGSSECFEGGYPLADTGDYSDIECPKCNSLAIDDNVSDPLHWVICGGESGHGARPMHPDWARKLRDDCQAAGVPYFFKQWGEYRPFEETAQAPFHRDCNTNQEYDAHGMDFIDPGTGQGGKFKGFKWLDAMDAIDVCESNTQCMFLKMGKKAAGRLLDGVEHNEMPEVK